MYSSLDIRSTPPLAIATMLESLYYTLLKIAPPTNGSLRTPPLVTQLAMKVSTRGKGELEWPSLLPEEATPLALLLLPLPSQQGSKDMIPDVSS